MSKCIVKPKKSEMYLLPNKECIKPNYPTLVAYIPYVQLLIAEGKLEVFASNLPDHADNNTFLEFLRSSKMDYDLAVPSYCSSLKVDIHGQELKEIEGPGEVIAPLDDDYYDPKESD